MTLYDRVMEYSQQQKEYYEFIPEECLELRRMLSPVTRCVTAALEGAPLDSIPQETYDILSLTFALDSRHGQDELILDKNQIRLLRDTLEGCEYCNQTQGCKYLKTDYGYKLAVFNITPKTKRIRRNLMKRLNKILED